MALFSVTTGILTIRSRGSKLRGMACCRRRPSRPTFVSNDATTMHDLTPAARCLTPAADRLLGDLDRCRYEGMDSLDGGDGLVSIDDHTDAAFGGSLGNGDDIHLPLP